MAENWREEYERKRKESFEQVRKDVKARMQEKCIDVLVATYSGYGDEGDVNDIYAFSRVDPKAEFPEMDDLSYGFTEEDHPGFKEVEAAWEDWDDDMFCIANWYNDGFSNNEGGTGFFIINRLTGKITGQHGVNETVTNYTPGEDEL